MGIFQFAGESTGAEKEGKAEQRGLHGRLRVRNRIPIIAAFGLAAQPLKQKPAAPLY
ncbi:hypothetical protein [Massilia sp. H6]|uniref:hypothetical protein n=1 Tax=Massilia sp. H6 TaxID=2970464 RepID=UPI002169FBA3|nr:hypothetical protein [Massilia sp. H6]UVW27734.1 hypothetical protein NRS07_14430 [Massilia sp. H6]